MALTESDIKIIIAAELKKAGFDKAAKATSSLEKSFKKLGRTIGVVFSAAAVVKFGKESVKAFQEAEREAALVRSQLEAINLGFASPLVNDYIDNLQALSGVSGGDLTNAFLSLSQATNDVTTAQELLNVALDISAATGKNLNSVSIALQRAYKGELTSLTRLRIGFTTAELKGKKFDEVLGELRDKFTGASARAADSYAGKIARLRAAVVQAQEAFGEGLVSGLESSGRSIEDLQKQIIAFGESLGELSAGVSNFANDTVDAFTKIRNNAAVEAVLNTFEALTRGIGFIVTGELIPSFDAQSARLAGDERRKAEEASRAALRSRNALLKAEKKIADQRKRESKETEKLAKAKTMFDMEQIQIQAALQGKITAEEKLRLQLMQAIIDENAAKAAKLTADLAKAQADTKLLAESMSKFVASDPFAFWATYFAAQKKERDDLDKDLNAFDANDPFSFWGAYWAMQKKERDSLDKDIKDIKGGDPFSEYPDKFKAQKDATAALDKDIKDIKAGDPFPGWDDYISARIAGVQALKAELASLSAGQSAAALVTTETKNGLTTTTTTSVGDNPPAIDLGVFPDFALPGLEGIDLSGLDILSSLQGFGGVNLSVNVEGSVISQEDFTAAILREFYKLQDQGVPLVTSSTAIGG